MSLFKNPIIKNLGILVSGTVVAQAILILFQLILRRLYSPSDFGAFAVYMSILGISASISSFRYDTAIVLPKKNDDGIKLLKISVFLSCVFSFLLFIPIVFFKDNIIYWLNFPLEYKKWLYVLPISIFMFSFSNAGNYFLIRKKDFKTSGSNKVIRRGSEGIVQSLFAIFRESAGLIIGDFIGQMFASVRIVIKNADSFFSKYSIQDYIKIAKQYKQFPLQNSIPGLFNNLSLLLPVIIINKIFSSQQTGHFDLARMLLIVPLSLITASLSQVLLQRFSEYKNDKKSIKKEATKIFISLTIFSLIFGLIITFFGESIFILFFGKQWGTSGHYAEILVWAFALKFIVSPFNIVFTAFNRIGILSIWQIFYFLLILLLAIIKFESKEQFLQTYLIIELISYSIAGFLSFGLIYKYETNNL